MSLRSLQVTWQCVRTYNSLTAKGTQLEIYHRCFTSEITCFFLSGLYFFSYDYKLIFVFRHEKFMGSETQYKYNTIQRFLRHNSDHLLLSGFIHFLFT